MGTKQNITKEVASLRGRVANAALRGDHETADQLRRDLRAARLAEHIQRVVDEAPSLTADQRSRLADLLRPGS